ncbi:MAG: anthranilate phosphoribosyltransferase [Candidatus Melainabacteria bacterium]|nr:anthranilate phosphoribosyltransferase [Candidatus Melainabacteria bacterium]
MLTEETIASLVECELPDEKIRQLLIELSSERLDLRILTAFINAVRAKCAFKFDGTLNAMDCSGTGGSGLPHFNTSTTVAFVLAAGGVKVAKFGNRAASSLSGSFDLLEGLGIPASVPYEHVHELLENVGLVFLYAPHYYPSLAKLSAIRRSLPGPSIFNSIGPLLHPLNPRLRLMGTSDALVYRLVADYLLADKHTEQAIVVRSERGLDEFDPCTISNYTELRDGKLQHYTLPAIDDIEEDQDIMTPEYSHEVFHQVLVGSAEPYFMHLVCQNAGAAFMVADKVATIGDGAALAKELLLTGAVAAKYEECRRAYAWFAS